MAGENTSPPRLSHDRQGDHARAIVHLVVPLAHEATAMRITDTAGVVPAGSGAISTPSDRLGDVDRTTALTPGIRTSTMATRTTTTRTTSSGPAPSADETPTSHADFSFQDLVAAYFDCRRTKRNTPSAIAFEQDLERNLNDLAGDLLAGTYRPGRSICFVITRPKPREVWAAAFRDRVVHHMLYNHVGPLIEGTFIADSCACIPGRGTLYAAKRLEAKIRSATENWSKPVWYLKCDLANFFVTIDKRILGALLAARIHEPWWRWLAELILFHDPRRDVEVRGDRARLDLVPAHKRLGSQPAHFGLPIGNLSSQFFANVYLDVLDRFVKHELGVRHYIRYVDDFILLGQPQELNRAHDAIAAFLPDALGARLNPRKTVLQPVERGVDFVGHVIKPWRRSIRRRTFREALSRVGALSPDDLHQSVNSYFGLLRQSSDSHGDRASLANLVRHRGHSVNRGLTKCFRKPI